MTVKSRIVAVHEDQGSIAVIYFDDETGVQVGPWNIDLPIVGGEYPSDAEIEKIIDGNMPPGVFERAAALATPPSMGRIAAKIGVERAHNANVFVTEARVVRQG